MKKLRNMLTLLVILAPCTIQAQTFEFAGYAGLPFSGEGEQLRSIMTPMFGLGASVATIEGQFSTGIRLDGQNAYRLKLQDDSISRVHVMNAIKIDVGYRLNQNLRSKSGKGDGKFGFKGSKIGGIIGIGMPNYLSRAPAILGIFIQPNITYSKTNAISLFFRTEFTYLTGQVNSTNANLIIGVNGAISSAPKPKSRRR